VLGDRLTTVELDQDINGKDEIAFAMYENHGAKHSLAVYRLIVKPE
jgi:hypothetical protein